MTNNLIRIIWDYEKKGFFDTDRKENLSKRIIPYGRPIFLLYQPHKFADDLSPEEYTQIFARKAKQYWRKELANVSEVFNFIL